MADRIELSTFDSQLARDREGDLLDALGMAGGVGIACIDRRVQRLNGLERVLLEHRVGLAELSRPGGERDGLAP